MMSARETVRKADELDARRQHQIRNQVDSINRLLDGATYDSEMAKLHEELACTQTDLDQAREELQKLRLRSQ